MTIDTWLTIFFGIIGSIGTFAAIYFERKASKLKKDRFRFSWHDVYEGTRELSKKAIKKYKPNVIITGAGGPSIVANLLVEHQQYFTYQITLPVEGYGIKSQLDCSNSYEKVPSISSDYDIWMPNDIATMYKDKENVRILIVDDAIFRNEIYLSTRNYLIEKGYFENNIKICTLVVLIASLKSKVIPDYYYFQVDTPNFYLPWGKI